MVPKFLLNRFSREGRNKQIYAFDKHTGREFCANVQKVAAETEFYDIVGEVPHSLEAGLSEIESLAAPILTTILKNESLAELNPRNRRILAAFCAIQFLRGQFPRELMRTVGRNLASRESTLSGNRIEGPTEREIKIAALTELGRLEKWAPHFESKVWMLLKHPGPSSFYISDTPITLFNEDETVPIGGLGLAVRGVEIHLPLDPVITLAMYCDTITSTIEGIRPTCRETEAASWRRRGGCDHENEELPRRSRSGEADPT